MAALKIMPTQHSDSCYGKTPLLLFALALLLLQSNHLSAFYHLLLTLLAPSSFHPAMLFKVLLHFPPPSPSLCLSAPGCILSSFLKIFYFHHVLPFPLCALFLSPAALLLPQTSLCCKYFILLKIYISLHSLSVSSTLSHAHLSYTFCTSFSSSTPKTFYFLLCLTLTLDFF